MRHNYSRNIQAALTEIQAIAAANLPKGKYLQIVNRCGKVVFELNKQQRELARGTGYVETVEGEVTHNEVKAFCEKMNTDKLTVLSWLHERPVTTLDCIEHNMLRASDIAFRLRKEGWPIGTKLVKSGRSRIAEYHLLGEQQQKPQPFVALKD